MPAVLCLLCQVINDDYNDFVSLSTKLVNVDGALARMQAPLLELQVGAAVGGWVGGWVGAVASCAAGCWHHAALLDAAAARGCRASGCCALRCAA